MKLTGLCVASICLAVNITALKASIIFMPGNNHQAGEQNILFESTQSGYTVIGTTDISDTSVVFSSTELLDVSANGPANLEAADGNLNSVTIELAGGGTYKDLIINPYVGSCNGCGPVTVTVLATDGTFSYSYPEGPGNGQNYLTILASPGEAIQSTNVSAATGFGAFRRMQISGITPAGQVPEPGTMLLLAGGLLVLGSSRLRLL